VAQINLLKQKKPSGFNGAAIFPILNKIAIIGLLAMLGFYIWAFLGVKKSNREIIALQDSITLQKQTLASFEGWNEILTRQAQLKNLNDLISGHLYWSQILPELAKITLSTAAYTNFSATQEGGEISLNVQMPSMAELDKFLQIFDSPKINKFFSNIKIGGISRIQNEKGQIVGVTLQMNYDPVLLTFKPPGN